MKHYHTTNATVPWAGIWFTAYGVFGGAQFGHYSTDKPEEQAKLDALVEEKKLTAITEADVAKAEKKTPRSHKPSIVHDNLSNPITRPEPLKGTGNVEVVAGDSVQPTQDAPQKPADLVQIGTPKSRRRSGGASAGE